MQVWLSDPAHGATVELTQLLNLVLVPAPQGALQMPQALHGPQFSPGEHQKSVFSH